MLAEGCFRKWLFPNYYVEIYFLKDIFLLFIYLFAIKYEFFLKKRLEKILIALAALVSLWGLIGYIIDGHSIAAYFLGLRSYWIFLPIAFIIANIFEADDLIKFIKINFYIIIPYFFLILLQTYSPESSIINSGYNSVVLAPHRPTGFFTFTTQNTFFIIFLSVLFFMYILYIKTLSIKNYIFIFLVNFFLISILILLKSRTVYIYYLFIWGFSFLSLFYLSDNKLKIKKILIILVFIPLLFLLSTKIFSVEYKFSTVRFNTDKSDDLNIVKYYQDKRHSSNEESRNYSNYYNKAEDFCEKQSSFCRVIDSLFFVSEIKKSSFFGHGIGAGSSTVATFLNKKKLYLGENESQRIVQELGYVVGVVINILKYLVIFFLFLFFLKKKTNIPALVPLLIFISVVLILGNITYSATFTSYIFWLCLGFLLSFFYTNKI